MATQASAVSTRDDDAAHALPTWFEWVQRNVLLSILILAEAYLLGSLMIIGWVPDLERPGTWGIYRGIGVALFFGAGALGAGIALKASLKAAACFKRRELGFALFNFVGVLAFCLVEIWASLSERSTNLHPTPADNAVLGLLSITHLPISPTVIIVSLLLPFVTLYYGFSQQKPIIKSADEIDADARRAAARIRADGLVRQTRAEVNAEIRSAQVGGLKSTWSALRSTGSEAVNSTGDGADDPPPDGTDGGSGPHNGSGSEAHRDEDAFRHLTVIARAGGTAGNGALHSTRAMAVDSTKRGAPARVVPLVERVRIAGGLAPQDVADVCQISRRYARELCARAHAQAYPEVRYTATTPVPQSAMIAYLRSTDSRVLHVHADALERALKLRQAVRKNATPSGSPQPREADLHRRGLYALERTSESMDGRLSSAPESAEDDAAAPA